MEKVKIQEMNLTVTTLGDLRRKFERFYVTCIELICNYNHQTIVVYSEEQQQWWRIKI